MLTENHFVIETNIWLAKKIFKLRFDEWIEILDVVMVHLTYTVKHVALINLNQR